MADHAPGPWIVVGDEYAATFVLEKAARDYMKGSKSLVLMPYSVARAAPELLEALEEALNDELCSDGFRPSEEKPHTHGCLDCQRILRARAVIAKAKGVTSGEREHER